MIQESRDVVGPLKSGRNASQNKDKNYQYSEESSYVGSEDFEYQQIKASKVNFDVDSDNTGNVNELVDSRGLKKSNDIKKNVNATNDLAQD